MPEPIEFQALANLQTSLQAIAITGGYFYDVNAAAVKMDPNVDVGALIGNARTRPFVLIQLFPEDDWQYAPALQLELKMPLVIHWVTRATETADEIRLQTFLRGCADVEKAITRDITRGGVAIDTRITKRALLQDPNRDGSEVWAQLQTEIWIYRTFGAPNG